MLDVEECQSTTSHLQIPRASSAHRASVYPRRPRRPLEASPRSQRQTKPENSGIRFSQGMLAMALGAFASLCIKIKMQWKHIEIRGLLQTNKMFSAKHPLPTLSTPLRTPQSSRIIAVDLFEWRPRPYGPKVGHAGHTSWTQHLSSMILLA